MELTLDELAARVGMTPRNIREWQTIGVLTPPQRRGRAAVYDDSHVARINRVKALRAEGFPLDIIRQFVDRSDDDNVADVLSLSATVLDPTGQVGTARLARTDLADRLGPDAEQALLRCGVITVEGEDVVVTDTAILEFVAEFVKFGLPISAIGTAVEELLAQQVQGLEAFVGLYRQHVWQPFVDADLPASGWRGVAESAGRMREVLSGLGAQTLRRAIDVVIARAAVEQAAKLGGAGRPAPPREN